MKKKDTIYLIIGLALLAIVAMLLYANYGSKGKDKGVTNVEVIEPISSTFNEEALKILADPTKVVNFQPIISLEGLGNTRPFGPLR